MAFCAALLAFLRRGVSAWVSSCPPPPGLPGCRFRLQLLLHAREQVVLRVDALVVAQIEAGHGFGHVLHGPHHLLSLGVEVDLGVPGEQHLEFFILIAVIAAAVARMQQFACGVAHQFTQCLAIGWGPSARLVQQFVQREHPLPARGRQFIFQRQQHPRVGLAVGADAVVPRRQRLAGLLDLADQSVEALQRRRQCGAGFAEGDLQGLGAHRTDSESTTEDCIVDERLCVNVPRRAVPLHRQMMQFEGGFCH